MFIKKNPKIKIYLIFFAAIEYVASYDPVRGLEISFSIKTLHIDSQVIKVDQ